MENLSLSSWLQEKGLYLVEGPQSNILRTPAMLDEHDDKIHANKISLGCCVDGSAWDVPLTSDRSEAGSQSSRCQVISAVKTRWPRLHECLFQNGSFVLRVFKGVVITN